MSDNFNRFPEIAGQLHQLLSQVVRKTALDIQAGYVTRCPKDTGFMANSAYTVTSTGSTYGQASPTHKGSYLLPSVGAPDNDLTAWVGVGANYALFVELGHVTRNGGHVPAQPAFYPAVDACRASFEAALQAIGGLLK